VSRVIFASPDWGAGALDSPIFVLCAWLCILTPFVSLTVVIALGIRDMCARERFGETRRNENATTADDVPQPDR
jgi:hypothetical protein